MYDGVQGEGQVFVLSFPTSDLRFLIFQATAGRKKDLPSMSGYNYSMKPVGAHTGRPVNEVKIPHGTMAHILLIDGDADSSNRIAEMLRPNFRVTTAFSIESAMTIAQEKSPDLVLSRVASLTSIRSHPWMRDLPVVVLTSVRPGETMDERTIPHGVDDCILVEPITSKELTGCIRAQLGMKQMREQFIALLKKSQKEADRQRDRFESMTQNLEDRVRERTDELQRRAEKLHFLALELSNAEDRERRRIGMILHDDLQQYLAALRFKLWNLLPKHALDEKVKKRIADFEQLIDESIQKCRNLSHELSPPVLQQGGLFAALEWLAKDMKVKHGLRINLQLDAESELKSPALASVLFQSIREILFNVAKHAGTDTAYVSTFAEDRAVRIVIRDNGKGFDPAAVKERQGSGAGFGLFSIEERLMFLGGRLEIESTPKNGCRVSLVVPMDRAHQLHVPETHIDHFAPAAEMEADEGSASSSRIRILLADDHAVMREGLANLLEGEENLKVVGHAENGLQAIRLARELNPDVILMDVSMPKKDGIRATADIVKSHSNIRIIGLSMHNDPGTRDKMMKAGASAYIYKAAPAQKLIETIRSVKAGSG